MPLTSAQLVALKAAIVAETDVEFVAARDAGNTPAMAAWLNQAASPAQSAWMTVADRRTLDEAADYSAFDSVVAGKRDAWRLFLDGAPRDMGKAGNRKTVTDVWGGSSSSGAVSYKVLSACVRGITRAEKVLGGNNLVDVGSGSGLVQALKLTWEGPLLAGDVLDALNV